MLLVLDPSTLCLALLYEDLLYVSSKSFIVLDFTFKLMMCFGSFLINLDVYFENFLSYVLKIFLSFEVLY